MAPECPSYGEEEGADYCSKGPRHLGPCIPTCANCGGSDWEDRPHYWVEPCVCEK